MAKPLVKAGWLSLQEAAAKYGQARASFYLWEQKGLLHLHRFPVGRPNVFINEQELTILLRGFAPHRSEREQSERAVLNSEALQKIWDNETDAVYDGIDWRTGKRAKA